MTAGAVCGAGVAIVLLKPYTDKKTWKVPVKLVVLGITLLSALVNLVYYGVIATNGSTTAVRVTVGACQLLLGGGLCGRCPALSVERPWGFVKRGLYRLGFFLQGVYP